jgi:hypothetical protein
MGLEKDGPAPAAWTGGRSGRARTLFGEAGLSSIRNLATPVPAAPFGRVSVACLPRRVQASADPRNGSCRHGECHPLCAYQVVPPLTAAKKRLASGPLALAMGECQPSVSTPHRGKLDGVEHVIPGEDEILAVLNS